MQNSLFSAVAARLVRQVRSARQLGQGLGIVAFDHSDRFKCATQSWHDVTRLLSDHLPVWIRLRTDQTDDESWRHIRRNSG
ncbi:MAG: hypothetical protein JSU70_07785 [Phycisphaerales bacterium]|nr:MAG: hypothetical protein JSU70_07785 [Phycisphaerales bacterium]